MFCVVLLSLKKRVFCAFCGFRGFVCPFRSLQSSTATRICALMPTPFYVSINILPVFLIFCVWLFLKKGVFCAFDGYRSFWGPFLVFAVVSCDSLSGIPIFSFMADYHQDDFQGHQKANPVLLYSSLLARSVMFINHFRGHLPLPLLLADGNGMISAMFALFCWMVPPVQSSVHANYHMV